MQPWSQSSEIGPLIRRLGSLQPPSGFVSSPFVNSTCKDARR